MKVATWNVDWWQRLAPQTERMALIEAYDDAVLMLQEAKAHLLDLIGDRRPGPLIRSTELHSDGRRGWSTCAIALLPDWSVRDCGLVPGLPRIQRGVWARASGPAGEEVTFVSWHAENAAEGDAARERKMAAYSAMSTFLAGLSSPVVLGGDFNTWSDDVDLQTPSEGPFEIEHAFVGRGPEHGLLDAYRTVLEQSGRLRELRLERPTGPLATSYRLGNGVPHRMDRIFVSPTLGVAAAGYELELATRAGSDHALHWADVVVRQLG